MKVVQINVLYKSLSTGKICYSISKLLTEEGIDNLTLYSQGKVDDKNAIKIGNTPYYNLQALKSRIFGNYGFNSKWATKKIIKILEEYKPDIVHMHNLHGHNANLTMLFEYFKKHPNIRLFWTFHDCWTFTGHCSHFTLVKCEQWKTHCSYCPLRREDSWFFDRSSWMFDKKKEAFMGLNMTIITPSKWLGGLVKQSFLKEYPVKVINNGIDLSVFRPTDGDFRKKYDIPDDKFVLLGVAAGWGVRKGLDVFLDLYRRLDKNKYQIVLVGTDDAVDRQLPKDIISIHKTNNQKELAEIYSAADLFVNPTREENYPTVNMESIACGTPVVTFDTGGSPEILDDKTGGVIPCDDVDALKKEIIRISENKPYNEEDCLERAKSFDMDKRFRDYVELYRQ